MLNQLMFIPKKVYSKVVPLSVRNMIFHRLLKRGCSDPEEIFVSQVAKLKASSKMPIVCAEVGVDKGSTTKEVLTLLGSGDQLDLYDRDSSSLFQNKLQSIPSGVTVNYFPNTSYSNDSYGWTLGNIVKEAGSFQMQYDIIFLDGAHVFNVDAAATCYLKEMLKLGGIIIFSDMTWTMAESYTMNNRRNRKAYPETHLKARHVSLIVDSLVRTDKRFEELESEDPDASIFRRISS